MPELVCKVQLAEPLGDAVARATMLDYRLRHQEKIPLLLFSTMTQARIAIAGKVSRTAARHLTLKAVRSL